MYVTAIARAFRCESARSYQFMVVDGAVLVYDDVAGHYTRCHSLSRKAQARIRKLAGV